MTARAIEDYLVGRISPGETLEDLLRFPRFFEIETVNACNARCPMCTIDDWNRHSPTMKDDLFTKIADEIGEHAATVRKVSLYRDGEPLLDKKLAPRIALLKDKGVRQVEISTNASLLDENRGRAILEAGLDSVLLSIDSLNKDVYESIRRGLVFEEVLENARAFIALRDSLRPSTRIWVRMVRQHGNADEWPSFERYWRDHLAATDRVSYHNYHNWGGQLPGFTPIASTHEPHLPCIALWSLMPIFADGRVSLCNVDYNGKYPGGSVATSSIAECWQSEVMRARRALHTSGRKAEMDICADCNVWDAPSDRDDLARLSAALST